MSGLRRSFDRAIARARERSLIQAFVGKRLADGTYLFKVDGRPECIWVTMRLSSGGQTAVAAVNAPGVPHSAKLAVEIRLEGEDYVIQRKSPKRVHSSPTPSSPDGNNPHNHDHGNMEGLGDDDHTQYHTNARGDVRYYTKPEYVLTAQATLEDTNQFILIDSGELKHTLWSTIKTTLNSLFLVKLGLSGGQTAYGGTDSGDDLTLRSTSHATKGTLFMPDNAIDFGDGTGSLSVRFNKGAGAFVGDFFFMVAGVGRWVIRLGSQTESGGDTGSDFEIRSRDDAGANKATLLYLERSTSNVGIGASTLLARLHVLQSVLGSAVLRLISTSTASDPYVDFIQNRVATTNATVTTLHTFAIAASQTYIIEVTVIARRTGGAAGTADDGAAYFIRAAYTTKAGTVTLLGGAVMQKIVAEDVAGWDCNLTISGSNVLLEVTGVASTNITWHMTKALVSSLGT